jgi:hypothetical protein
VSENKVLRRIFETMRDGVTGGWRKLHNEELHNLCSSSNSVWWIKPRSMKWMGHAAHMGQMIYVYKTLV